jgi:hypothetical protein
MFDTYGIKKGKGVGTVFFYKQVTPMGLKVFFDDLNVFIQILNVANLPYLNST